ncbi:MAG TPA: hypothetical protein VF637_08165 [Sphingomicrobium sp.]
MDAKLLDDARPQSDKRQCWARLPAELRDRSQWVLAEPGEKRPRTIGGGYASSTAPGTWADFESVCTAAAARGWEVGYVLSATDPFTCIDLDVKDTTSVEDEARFQSIIISLDSYTERSRSGRGWHIWVRADIGPGRRRGGVEVYSRERFIICTGDVSREQPIALGWTPPDGIDVPEWRC